MDIVLSHISALRFWLSRPACSVRLRYADPILPVSALPKGKAAELAVYGGVPVHVLCAGPIKGGVRNGAIYHTWQGDLPAGSVARIAPGLCVCSPELSFLQMAQTLDEVSQIRLGFELCGSYSLDARADGGFFKRSPLTTPEKNRRIVRHRARSTWGKTSENRRAARHHRVCFSGGNASCHDVVHAVSIGRCRVTVTCAKSSDIAIVVSAAIAPAPLFSLRLILARKAAGG